MNQEQLERVKDVLDEALARDPAERPAYLDKACSDDSEVRREVRSLLEQERVTLPILDHPVFSLHDLSTAEPARYEAGEKIGPYQIVSELGEGGMGTVYLARREDDFEKRVAIKLIRAGRISEDAVRRFHNERQILAQLEHPSIARILDGGTTEEGDPYFVMEHVEGDPIDRYCEHHGLSLERRLELVRDVCGALAAAHRSLVVHRDLKPSNILVTADGVPKLLDFGIAKRLAGGDDEVPTELTSYGQLPMTLRYASPEQVQGSPLTTASDVYSLGVLLFELLTGRHPYAVGADASALTLARAIWEEEPARPSTVLLEETLGEEAKRLERRLAGDLDSIVLKALAKDPAKRYGSVTELSEDLRRYLEGLPVLAREGTWPYLASKFVRRHRLAVVAAVLVVLVFGLAASSGILWQQKEHERVLRGEVNSFINDLLLLLILDVGSHGESMTEELHNVEVRLAELETPLSDRAGIFETAGRIYSDRGLLEPAREALEIALKLQQHGGDPRRLAVTLNNMGTLYYELRDYDEALRVYREVMARKQSLGEDDIDFAKTYANMATSLMALGELKEAEELYLTALEIYRQRSDTNSSDYATNLRSLGNLYYVWSRIDEAEVFALQALELRREILPPWSRQIAAAWSLLGRIYHAQGRIDEAEVAQEECLKIRLRLYGDSHPLVANVRRDLAALALDRGQLDLAETLLDQVLPVLREAETENPSWDLAEAESLLGALYTARGRFEEAEPLLVKGYETLAEVRGPEAIYTKNARRRLHDYYLARGLPEKAMQYADEP